MADSSGQARAGQVVWIRLEPFEPPPPPPPEAGLLFTTDNRLITTTGCTGLATVNYPPSGIGWKSLVEPFEKWLSEVGILPFMRMISQGPVLILAVFASDWPACRAYLLAHDADVQEH